MLQELVERSRNNFLKIC